LEEHSFIPQTTSIKNARDDFLLTTPSPQLDVHQHYHYKEPTT
jgi:hypothetical protein